MQFVVCFVVSMLCKLFENLAVSRLSAGNQSADALISICAIRSLFFVFWCGFIGFCGSNVAVYKIMCNFGAEKAETLERE